jgi:hypothetical protein
LTEPSVTTAGNFAQWYFADPALRSDPATASMITFLSSGVRSRWPILKPAVGGGASLDARGVCVAVVPVTQPESAKPTASGAITLRLDICKARGLLDNGGKYSAAARLYVCVMM